VKKPETCLTPAAVHVWPGSATDGVPHLVMDRGTGETVLMVNTTVHSLVDMEPFDNVREFLG
jgi:hypothetical protein